MDTLSNTVAAIDSEQQKAKLFVALELGQATWVVALHSPIADKISIYRIEGGDTDQLMALIEKKRVQAARRLGRAAQVVSCYEAGRDGFWLHRFLIRRGIDNRVLDSASILVDRRARRAKTDRLDARALLRVLMALVRGEEQVCRVVRVPSIAQEDERRLSRERERLLHERNSHIARIKGLLILHGVRDYRLIERDWKERLDAVRTTEGQALPARAKTEIERECRRLWLAKQMLAEVEREIEQMIAHDGAVAGKLIQVRGIGQTFASVLTHEVYYRSFDNRRQVGSYLGLVSIPWQSERGVGGPRCRAGTVPRTGSQVSNREAFLRGHGTAGEHVGSADQGRSPHAPGREWRRRMVADCHRPGTGACLCHQPASANALPGRKLALSEWQAVARRRLHRYHPPLYLDTLLTLRCW
jgi:transposase